MIRDLLDTSPIGLAIVTTATKERVFVNQSLIEMFGAVDSDDMLKRSIKESWVDEDRFLEADKIMSAEKNLVDFQAQRYRIDGSKWWVLLNSHFTDFDGKPARVLWHVDITEMVEARADIESTKNQLETRVQSRTRQLQETEKRFRDFAEIASDWFWEMDGNLKYTYVSDAYEIITGKSPEALIGKTRREMYKGQFPEERDRWLSYLDKLDAHENFDNFTVSYRRDDGELRSISSSGRAYFDENGTFQGYRGVGFDRTEQQRLQAQLRDNQAQMLAFSKYSSSPATIFDIQGKFLLVNDVACNNFGLPRDQVVGKTIFELYRPEEANSIYEQMQVVTETGKPQHFEFTTFHQQREMRTYLAERFPIFSADGDITSIGNVNTDITARKRTEEALRDSEARFQVIVDMQNDLVTRFTPDWKLTFVNRAYCEFVNDTEENLIGASMFADVPKNVTSRLISYFENFTPESAAQNNENQLQRFDGEIRDFEWSNFAQFDSVGNVIRYQSVGRDMTERKISQQALLASEARYQSVVDGQSELITRFTPDGAFTFVNDSYCQFIGLPEKEVMERSNFQERPEDEIAILKKYLTSFTPDNPIQNIENTLRRHDGEIREIEWQDTARFDDAGSVVEFQSVARDVTEQRKAQREIVLANEKAQEANRAKSNFLSTMSHEIRTPLNGVLGLAQLLTDSKLDVEQRKKVDTILSSGQTLLAIINDVLDMSKIEAGGLELEETAFSLRDLVSVIATPFQSLADDKGIKLRVSDSINSGLFLKGDPVRLRQILWNLLSNAIKFTDRGDVKLSIREVAKTLEPVSSEGDHTIVFTVSDSGGGIAPERLDAIFDAFTQEDSSITRKFGGTGLGLSIVKQLTQMMGGTISATSELGKGSQFEVTVPFRKATKAEAEKLSLLAGNQATAFSEPMQILIAEDNPVNAMIARSFLEKFGHQVKHAENGKQAVAIAAEDWADLILMDIHMPEMDGIEATRTIRGTKIGATLPILGLTAEAFSERHAHFREAGMNDVLTKPFTEIQLADMLAIYGIARAQPENTPKVTESGETSSSPDSVEATTAEETMPIGDDRRLDELRKQMPAEVMSNLLEKACESLLGRMQELRDGVAEQNAGKIKEAAHSIKGSSGSMFALRVSVLAAYVEENCDDLDVVRQQIPLLEAAAEETIEWWHSK